MIWLALGMYVVMLLLSCLVFMYARGVAKRSEDYTDRRIKTLQTGELRSIHKKIEKMEKYRDWANRGPVVRSDLDIEFDEVFSKSIKKPGED